MANNESAPSPRVAVEVTNIHNLDGKDILETVVHSNVPMDEADRIIEDHFRLTPVNMNSRRGKVVVGFTKWRSSWDPHADGYNPDLN